VQVLRNSPKFLNLLRTIPDKRLVEKYLLEIVELVGVPEVSTTMHLRYAVGRLCGKNYQAGRMEDVMEFFQDLIHLMQENVQDMFELKIHEIRRFWIENKPTNCPECGNYPPSEEYTDLCSKNPFTTWKCSC
jgi:hypothetical protein